MGKGEHKFTELPVVAIVGRPNVGKSTLVNRISTGPRAIVDATAGVTRDRNYIESDWRGRPFILVDTGGIDFQSEDRIVAGVTWQSKLAANESDVVIHVVDGRDGITADDGEIASMLREMKVPVILAVNKIDSEAQKNLVYEFYELSEGEPEAISAIQGLGIGELLDRIIEVLPPEGVIGEETGGISVAIVGKPNVGKSQLLNKILGFERVLVSNIPGTTRDSIHSSINRDGTKYLFIDTAGLRRKAVSDRSIEYYSWIRTVRSMEMAEIIVLMVDATEGLTDQDQRIARMASDRDCAVVIVFNKWDLIEDGKERSSFLRWEVETRMGYLNNPFTITCSALTGHHVNDLFKAIDRTHDEFVKHIQTAELNKLISEVEHLPPVVRGKKLKIYYATQMEKPPPAVVFFVNNPALVNESFRRHLVNKIKKGFGFRGCPVRIVFRRKK